MSDLSNPKSERKEKDIQKQLEQIQLERKEMDELRRFGFFTIPYPATVGDLAYSTTNQKKKLQNSRWENSFRKKKYFCSSCKKRKRQ